MASKVQDCDNANWARRPSRIPGLVIIVLGALGVRLALAQQAEPAEGAAQLEEVMVTAQRRSQNLQDVPIAITVFGQEVLTKLGVIDVSQIGRFAPNVETVGTSPFSGSTQTLSAYIRGIGQNDFAFNLDPGVGVYVDGVYFARTAGATADLFDVDHVEVLKGPQGTLFGRNTIGGAISVVTRDPADSIGGRTDVTFGSYKRVDVRGLVDIPLIEHELLSSLSFTSKKSGGYFDYLRYPGSYASDVGNIGFRPDSSTYDTAGGIEEENARAKVVWLISERSKFVLAADLSNSNDQGTPSQLLRVYDSIIPGAPNAHNDPVAPIGVLYNLCVAGLGPPPLCNAPRGGVSPAFNFPVGVPLSPAPGVASSNYLQFNNSFVPTRMDTSYSTGAGYSKIESYGASATFTTPVSERVDFKSLTAYRRLLSGFAQDADGTPIPMGDHAFRMDQWQVSEETQLSGSFFDDLLKSVGGLYYMRERGSLLEGLTFGGGLIQIYSPNEFRTASYAAYLHNAWKATSKLELTAGVRYSRDDKQVHTDQHDLNAFWAKLLPLLPPPVQAEIQFPEPADTTLYIPDATNRQTFSNTSGLLGVDYHIAEDLLAYASFSQGYKSGGWTTRAVHPLTAVPTFAPEKANTVEMGFKAQFLDHRLQTNLAAFDTDYKDLQVTVYDSFGEPFTLNAARSRIKGAELETVARIYPTYTLTATLGYVNAIYTELPPITALGGATAAVGSMFVNTPKWSGSVSSDWRVPVFSRGTLLLHADASAKSRMARDSENTPELISGGYTVVGVLASYQPSDSHWHFDAGVANLTARRFIVTGQNQTGMGYIAGTYNLPREWYARFGYEL